MVRFREYMLLEALLNTENVAKKLYSKTAVGKVVEEIKRIMKDTMRGKVPEPSYVDMKMNQWERALLKVKEPVWKHANDPETRNALRQAGAVFTASINFMGDGPHYRPQDQEIHWGMAGMIIRTSLLRGFAGEEKKFYNDISRAVDSIEHEYSHLLRDLKTAHISRFVHRLQTDPKVREQYTKHHGAVKFEVDAIVHALRKTKERVGAGKWDSMTWRDLERLIPNLSLSTQTPREKKFVQQRLAREALLGKRRSLT